MAEIQFYANIKGSGPSADGLYIDTSEGSGIGFYGDGFAVSVPVGSVQRSTWVTNSLGADEGPNLNNTAKETIGDYTLPEPVKGTVSINGLTPINLDRLPNYLCPLNIRFTHTEPVAVQNCELLIFDRNNIENHAVGVTTYVYESRHPSEDSDLSNLNFRGRTEDTWYEFDPELSLTAMPFTPSPGPSGTNTLDDTDSVLGWITNSGADMRSDRHDWYVALSAEPESVGSKIEYGLYFSLEYL